MTSSQIVVTLLGLLAIGWVNYYFFVAGRGAAVAAAGEEAGPQRTGVEVEP